MRNSVDFPAPFGPSNAVTPASKEKLTSETATTLPNVLDAPDTSIIWAGGGGFGAIRLLPYYGK